jgi:hypothetical protein
VLSLGNRHSRTIGGAASTASSPLCVSIGSPGRDRRASAGERVSWPWRSPKARAARVIKHLDVPSHHRVTDRDAGRGHVPSPATAMITNIGDVLAAAFPLPTG